MYETVMMIKRGNSFTPEQMEALVREVCSDAPRVVSREERTIIIQSSEGNYLQIEFNDEPSVIETSIALAEEYELDCADCPTRYEMQGEDDGMDLFNDYLLINERLEDLGLIIVDMSEDSYGGE